MANYKTHLTALADAAAAYPAALAFQLPILNQRDGRVEKWQPITYRDFLADVEHFATYWNDVLVSDSIAPRSVVGLW